MPNYSSRSPYEQFMENHRTKDTKLITHTRIGDVENHNVYPGKYHIPPEELPEFYRLYNEHVFVQGHKEYLTEKQSENVFAVDFDFRYEKDATERYHQNGVYTLDKLVHPFISALATAFVVPEKLTVYIMEKPNMNHLPEYTKDGLHMIIGCRADRHMQEQIRLHAINFITYLENKKESDNTRLPLINAKGWADVIDDKVTNGKNNWQL